MELIQRIKNSALVKNSFILFVGMMTFNVLNYAYHLVMGRMLSVESFGELEAIFSLLYIGAVPAMALLTVAMRYISIYRAEDNPAKVITFFKKIHKKLLLVGVLVIGFFAVTSPFIASFLKLRSNWPIIILGWGLVFSMLAYLIQGILQGWQKFKGVSMGLIIQGISKVGFAVLLVWLSFDVAGAIGGVALGALTFYLILLYLLRPFFKYQTEKEIDRRQILKFCLPVFISTLVVTFLYSLDMILVKHFFSEEIAGQYGALTILGKVIFFATMPLISVMFPMVAESHSLKGNYQKILKQSLFLVCLVGFTPVVLYFLVPKLVVSIMVGSKFLMITPYLGWLGLAIFFVSLINFLSNFFLSVHKTKFVYFILFGVLALVVLISLYHQSIGQIVWIMNGVMIGILVLLLGYFLKIKKQI